MGCNSSKVDKNTYKYRHHGKIMSGQITAVGHKAVTIKDHNNREWYGNLHKLALPLKKMNYYELLYRKVNFRANTNKYSGHQLVGPRYYAIEITDFIIIL